MYQTRQYIFHDFIAAIYMNNKFIFIRISLKFDHKGPVDNKAALVQVMACRVIGAKLLPRPMLIQFTDAYMWYLGGASKLM